MIRSIILVFIFAFIALNQLSFPQDTSITITEDFSGPNLAKLGLPGIPTDNGNLLVKGEIVFPHIVFDDAIIEADVLVEGEGILDMKFRIDDEKGKFYMFRVDTRPDYPSGFLKSDPEIYWRMMGKQYGPKQKPNTWYHIKVEIKGNKFVGYINDEEIASYEDDELKEGYISFMNEICPARVDNLKIVFPPGAKFTLPKPKVEEVGEEDKWRAYMIWAEGTPSKVYFRKTFDVPEDVIRAVIFITADNAFILYVNGKEVGRHNDWYTPQTYCLNDFLHKGRNVIAIEATNEEPPGEGAAGLLVDGAIYTKTKYIPIISDESFKYSLVEEKGWKTQEYNDSSWKQATIIGKFPCSPWMGQVKWVAPDFGPKSRIVWEKIELPRKIILGEPLTIKASLKIEEKINEDLSIAVKVLKGAKEIIYGEAKPSPSSKKWQVGERIATTLNVIPHFYSIYLFSPGKYKLFLELPGFIASPQKEVNLMDRKPKTQKLPVPLNKFVVPKKGYVREGIFTDIWGHEHRWALTNDGKIIYDGEKFIPVRGSDGVYFCKTDVREELKHALQELSDEETLNEIKENGITQDIIRCKLVDYIDCTKEEHGFSEDGGLGGKSRVLEINGKKFRVTSNRPKLSYFIYRARIERPGYPHILVAETINDIERYTTIRIQPPWDNVGGGVFTGGEYPCDGKPFNFMFIFYPRGEDITITVSREPCEAKIEENSGAAVSQIWILDILDNLFDKPVDIHPTNGLPERSIGIYYSPPPYMWQLYGFKKPEGIKSFLDYLKFLGMNFLIYNAIDGGDNTSYAFYESKYFPFSGTDIFKLLLPLAEKENIRIVPIVTSLTGSNRSKELYRDSKRYDPNLDHPGWSKDSYQLRRDGQFTTFFGFPLPDPLRPEVQELMFNLLREIAEQTKNYKCVQGIGFRVNGKIGLCYAGSPEALSEEESGYSEWDLREFEKDEGINIPDKSPNGAFEWLKANAWEKWIDWRCKRTRDFWLKCRDLIRSIRSDWKLWVSTALPSESPGRNINWVDKGMKPLDILRHHGYDPRMYKNEKGIIVQRGIFVAGGEYFGGMDRGGLYGKNRWAWKAWDYLPEVAEFYTTAEGTACEVYHNYWEEGGFSHTGASELGTAWANFWGAATMFPLKRYYFQPLTNSIRRSNPHTLVLFSWERGSFGHEYDLRSFCRAWRALPAVSPQDFDGVISPIPDETLWVKWFADRLAIVNDSPEEREIELTIPRPLKKGEAVIDFATNRILLERDKDPLNEIKVKIKLKPFDLHTLVILKIK